MKRRQTALIVDDIASVRAALARLLQSHGYEVVTAENGADALLLLSGVCVDVILLDEGMPVMSGREFRKRQRDDPRLAQIPVVLISAAPNLDPVADDTGLVECAPKTRPDTLVAAVARACLAGVHRS